VCNTEWLNTPFSRLNTQSHQKGLTGIRIDVWDFDK